MGPRHARGRGGRHLRPTPVYQGWDPADQLAMAQAGDTPPMGFPAVRVVQPPRPPMPAALRWTIAGLSAMAGGFVVLVLMLGLALYVDSTTPAEANGQPQSTSQTVAVPNQTVRTVVAGDRVRVVAAELCPTEDSCTIDFVGDGTYVIERTVPLIGARMIVLS